MDSPCELVWQKLCSTNKLDRDQGSRNLKSLLSNDGDSITPTLISILNNTIDVESINWETKLAILELAGTLSVHNQDESLNFVAKKAIHWLSDEEVRVRIASGEYLGILCTAFGPSIYENYKTVVIDLIRENIDRAFEKTTSNNTSGITDDVGDNNSGRMSPQEQIFHESAGWRNLETSVKCIQSMINGCTKGSFQKFVDDELLDLIFTTLSHENRFVRETGYQTCASIIQACSSHDEQQQPDEPTNQDGNINPIRKFALKFADQLAIGLADNWSQVRMASCTATRQFLMSLELFESIDCAQQNQPHTTTKIASVLMPRLCLNRYYLAEGVRIYSQDTWVMLLGNNGKKVVEDDIGSYVTYYKDCTKADNHAVREAACQCIAELASKISPDILAPHVNDLLSTLIETFHDDSWPVRDMACVACGTFISHYPGESSEKFSILKELFVENLKDPIASVRQGAAQAIGKSVKAYYQQDNQQQAAFFIKLMTESFQEVKNQPIESNKYADFTKNPANFGVVKRLRDNDPELHENQTMYSCGSLAPKMQRTGGGCGDCKFKKPSEPWEAADGCVYLANELAEIPELQEPISNLLPQIQETARHRHYTMHYYFIESVAKVLPLLAKKLGKKLFKPYLEGFFNCLFYAIESENALASSASTECLKQLSVFLGPNILKGRVEMYDSRYLVHLDQILASPCIPIIHSGNHSSSRPQNSHPGSLSISIPNSDVRPSLGGTPTGSPR